MAVRKLLERGRIAVAEGAEFEVLGVFFDRAKVVLGDATAADDGDLDLAVGDGLWHRGVFLWLVWG